MSKTYSAGVVTAYGAAKAAGYTGTYEEFCAAQAELAEGAEKLANGMTLLIREGSSARNLETLLPAVSDHSKLGDAAAALTALGYSAPEINAVLKRINSDELTLEETVKAALKLMMK